MSAIPAKIAEVPEDDNATVLTADTISAEPESKVSYASYLPRGN